MNPLHNKLKTQSKHIELDEKEAQSFTRMQNAIYNSINLNLPQFDQKFYIHTDASNYSIAGVISQYDKNKNLKLIFYISRKLNKHEENYTIMEK